MSNYYKFVTANSIIVPNTSTVLYDVQKEWRDVFGSSLSVDSTTPQGRLIEMESNNRKGVIEICAFVSNQINPFYSTGQFLDGIGALFARNRKSATKTAVSCVVSGVNGTVIPAGSQVSDGAGNIFSISGDVTIPSGGSTTAVFYALNGGSLAIGANTVNKIITPVIGWETVNNPSAGQSGSNIESDDAFRKRILATRYSGVGLIGDIESRVLNVDGVKSVAIYNNSTNSTVNWNLHSGIDTDIPVGAHSVCVIVYGGTNNDVGNALFDTVSAGCGYTSAPIGAGTTATVTISSKYTSYAVKFIRPTSVNCYTDIIVKKNRYPGTDAELEDEIKSAVADFINGGIAGIDGMELGSSLYSAEIASAISSRIQNIIVQSVLVGTSASPTAQYVNSAVYQIITIPESNIGVTIN